MIDEKYKEQLNQLESFGKKEGYISLKQVTDAFAAEADNEDLLDEVVRYLEKKGYEVTESLQDDVIVSDKDLDDDLSLDDIVNELDDDKDLDDDLITEEETEIKVSDFDNIDSTPYQTDDTVKMYLHEIGQVDLLTMQQESEYARMVQEGLMSKEKKEKYARDGRTLSPEELKELDRKIENGKQAQDILIESNLRLVVNLAKRYINRGLPLADLIQEGNMGLMKAVVKFDPTRGFKFSTYATWWIRQAITRAIADKGRNVRIPVHMVECINRLTRTRRKLVQEKHREPTIEEVAAEMRLPVEKVVELQRVSQDSLSFDSSVGDEEDSTLMDLVPDNETLNPLEYTEKTLYKEEIDDVLQTLTPREEMVIRLRYGIAVDKPHTLEEVGKIMGVTRERVRQIEAKALSRLRHHQRMNRLKQHVDR